MKDKVLVSLLVQFSWGGGVGGVWRRGEQNPINVFRSNGDTVVSDVTLPSAEKKKREKKKREGWEMGTGNYLGWEMVCVWGGVTFHPWKEFFSDNSFTGYPSS